MFLLIFWIVAAIAIGYVASQRGRNGLGHGLFALLLTPLWLFIVMALPALPVHVPTPGEVGRRRKETGWALLLLVSVLILIYMFPVGTFRGDSSAHVYSGWLRPDSGARVSVCSAAGETGCIPTTVRQPLRVQ